MPRMDQRQYQYHYDSPDARRRPSRRFSGFKLRLMIGVGIVLFSLFNYYTKGQKNPFTGERQHVDLTVQQEIQLGRQSAPSMGQTSRNFRAQARVERVGQELVAALDRLAQQEGGQVPYPFQFHLLDDSGRNRGSINAFALPGGQVFVTEALYRRLDPENNGELVGVLGHEVGHVIERHAAQQMASSGLLQGIAGAAGVAGGDYSSVQAASMLGNLMNMKYGRDDELESDGWGVRLMTEAGYRPDHLIEVMEILEDAGGSGGPEFMSTHPRPENRRDYIREIITKTFPQGLPSGLK